jgi:hypothetical protein
MSSRAKCAGAAGSPRTSTTACPSRACTRRAEALLKFVLSSWARCARVNTSARFATHVGLADLRRHFEWIAAVVREQAATAFRAASAAKRASAAATGPGLDEAPHPLKANAARPTAIEASRPSARRRITARQSNSWLRSCEPRRRPRATLRTPALRAGRCWASPPLVRIKPPDRWLS